MAHFQPTGIQIHLTTGRKHLFYQDSPGIVADICADLDTKIFSRENLIIESASETTSFPGHALIGITILTDPLPEILFEREKLLKTVVTQISHETFQYRRLQLMAKIEGNRSAILCELEFTNGESVFIECSEIAGTKMEELNVMSHLFKRPSLFCRRLEAGLSVWNTAHIVSWSHYPKLQTPDNAWLAEPLAESVSSAAKVANLV